MNKFILKSKVRLLGTFLLAVGLMALVGCAGQQKFARPSAPPASEVTTTRAENVAEASDQVSNAEASANLKGVKLDDLNSQIDNPFFVPLTPLLLLVHEGEETDDGETVHIRVESRVLPERQEIAGVEVSVIQVEEYEDGELLDITWEFYAQGDEGAVIYMGEAVNKFEDGEVVSNDGQWFVGDEGTLPGVFMPANPKIGDQFMQERVPGVAIDESTVVEVGLTMETPAGAFVGCIKTKDTDLIDNVTEYKFYCPGIGLVQEQFEGGFLNIVDVGNYDPESIDEELISSLRKWVGF